MKRAATILLASVALALTGMAYAAGTITDPAEWTKINKSYWKKTITWTDDTAGISATVAVPSGLRGAQLHFVLTDPGSPAPTDNYDIEVRLHGVDYMGGAASNRDAANTEVAFPTVSTRPLDDDITFVLSGNAVSGATGTVTFYIFTD